MSAKDKITQADALKHAKQTTPSQANDSGPNWRKGNFKGPESELSQANEQAQGAKQQSIYGANVTSVTIDDPSKMSKHAKRRANKKAKQAEQSATQASS